MCMSGFQAESLLRHWCITSITTSFQKTLRQGATYHQAVGYDADV